MDLRGLESQPRPPRISANVRECFLPASAAQSEVPPSVAHEVFSESRCKSKSEGLLGLPLVQHHAHGGEPEGVGQHARHDKT